MKYFLLFIISFSTLFTASVFSQSLIINRHSVARFDSIPVEFKMAAVQQRMMFMDRSVGWNISSFLDCLSEPWNEAPSFCKRYQHMDTAYSVDPAEVYWQGAWDRSNWYFRFWPEGCSEDVTCFIDIAEERLDSFDIMGCQFSYLAVVDGAQIADPVNGFFGDDGNVNKASTYAAFAAAHPEKKLIWWTTSLARGIGTQVSESFNSQMRDYAATHDIILFDVADILSHDPDGAPCYDNRDGVAYKDENHPDDGLDIPAICPQYTTETEGGHLGSISAGGVRVAKAFWVLMAMLAGWEENVTGIAKPVKSTFNLYPNPAREEITLLLEKKSEVQKGEILICDVMGMILQKVNVENSTKIQIPVNELPTGLYSVILKTDEGLAWKKFIKGRFD